MDEQVVDARLIKAKDHGMVIERFDLPGAQQFLAGDYRIVAHVQMVAVHHVVGGDRPPAEMPFRFGFEPEGPLGEILVVLPALGEPRIVELTGAAVVADQAVHRGVESEIAGRAPEEVGLGGERVHHEHQSLDLVRRGPRCAEKRQSADDAENGERTSGDARYAHGVARLHGVFLTDQRRSSVFS